jgi:prepilin-type N-terminal cleavage/methylation domain-containing protein
MNRKGFTLIELLIVVAIIGILAAIAVPAYIGQQKRAARTEAYSNLQNLRLLEEQFFAENGEYAPAGAGTGTKIYYKSGNTTISNSTNLPGFKPSDASNLNFEYEVEITAASGGRTTAFTARAIGRTGTRVAGDTFWINNNNDRNF